MSHLPDTQWMCTSLCVLVLISTPVTCTHTALTVWDGFWAPGRSCLDTVKSSQKKLVNNWPAVVTAIACDVCAVNYWLMSTASLPGTQPCSLSLTLSSFLPGEGWFPPIIPLLVTACLISRAPSALEAPLEHWYTGSSTNTQMKDCSQKGEVGASTPIRWLSSSQALDGPWKSRHGSEGFWDPESRQELKDRPEVPDVSTSVREQPLFGAQCRLSIKMWFVGGWIVQPTQVHCRGQAVPGWVRQRWWPYAHVYPGHGCVKGRHSFLQASTISVLWCHHTVLPWHKV